MTDQSYQRTGNSIVVPAWRGLFHELAIAPVAVFSAWVVVSADGVIETVALLTHSVALLVLLTVSSVYHRHCRSEVATLRARRADHAAIFALIAGTYTPLCLLATPRWLGLPVLVAAWCTSASAPPSPELRTLGESAAGPRSLQRQGLCQVWGA